MDKLEELRDWIGELNWEGVENVLSDVVDKIDELNRPLVVTKDLGEWLGCQKLGNKGILFSIIIELEDMWSRGYFEEFIDTNKKELIEVILGTRPYEVEKDEFQDGHLKIKSMDIVPLIDQLDEPKKVVIPRLMADHIELCKSKNKRLNVALSESPEDEMAFEMGVSLEEANEIYARAWLDGYEVEKEKLYQVIIPTKDTVWDYYYLDDDGGINMTSDLKYVECHTEDFIRSVSDDLWQFAVEVEG